MSESDQERYNRIIQEAEVKLQELRNCGRRQKSKKLKRKQKGMQQKSKRKDRKHGTPRFPIRLITQLSSETNPNAQSIEKNFE